MKKAEIDRVVDDVMVLYEAMKRDYLTDIGENNPRNAFDRLVAWAKKRRGFGNF